MNKIQITKEDHLWCNALLELIKRYLEEKHDDISNTIDNILKLQEREDYPPNSTVGVMTEQGDQKLNPISHTEFVKTLKILKTKVNETFSNLVGSEFYESKSLSDKVQQFLRKNTMLVLDPETNVELTNLNLQPNNGANQLDHLVMEKGTKKEVEIPSAFKRPPHITKNDIKKIPKSFLMEIESSVPKRVDIMTKPRFCKNKNTSKPVKSTNESQSPIEETKCDLTGKKLDDSGNESNSEEITNQAKIKVKGEKKSALERKTNKDIVNSMTEEYKRMVLALQEKKIIRAGKSLDDSDDFDASDDSLKNLEKVLEGKKYVLAIGGCDTKLSKSKVIGTGKEAKNVEKTDQESNRHMKNRRKKKNRRKEDNLKTLKKFDRERCTWGGPWWEDIEPPTEILCDCQLKTVINEKQPYVKAFEQLQEGLRLSLKKTEEELDDRKPSPEKSIELDLKIKPNNSLKGERTPKIQELFDVSEDSDDDYVSTETLNSEWARL